MDIFKHIGDYSCSTTKSIKCLATYEVFAG